MLQRLAKDVIALGVLFVFSTCIFGLGWGAAITFESSAIKLERSVYSMIEFDKHFPPPEPGWESCTENPVPGEIGFVIKLCRRTPIK